MHRAGEVNSTAIWRISSNPMDCNHDICIPQTSLGTGELAQSTTFPCTPEMESRYLHILLKEDPKEKPTQQEQAAGDTRSCHQPP